MKDITVLCLFVFLRNFSFSFRNMNSSKMPEETLFLSRKAMVPEGMLPHRHSSVNSLDNFWVLLHWGTLCLPQALPWQGRSSAWLSQSQPRQNPQESQDLAPDPNRALLPKIYAPQLHLKLLPFSLSIKWFVPQFPLSPSQSLAVLGVWDVTATRDKAEKMKVNLITLFFFFFGENRYFLSLQASHKAALLLLVCSQTPK